MNSKNLSSHKNKRNGHPIDKVEIRTRTEVSCTSKERSTYDYNFKLLNDNKFTSDEILRKSAVFNNLTKKLCIRKALKLKEVLIKDYASTMLGLDNVFLSSLFDFDINDYLRKVTHRDRDNAIGVKILNRILKQVKVNFLELINPSPQQICSYKTIQTYIGDYKLFSEWVSRKRGAGALSISDIRYDKKGNLLPKSWLYENLRYIFSLNKFGLPIRNNELSWLIFGKDSKLKETLEPKRINTRIDIFELLSLDYRIYKLRAKDYNKIGLNIGQDDIKYIRKKVSQLIYFYIFSGYHNETYVSPTTDYGIKVGRSFFTIEYEVIRAIFFGTAEVNYGVPLSFLKLKQLLGVDLKRYLYSGRGFASNLLDFKSFLFKLRNIISKDRDIRVVFDAIDIVNKYENKHDERKAVLIDQLGGRKSYFQLSVEEHFNDYFGIKLEYEKPVWSVVGAKYVTVLEENGKTEKIYVHGNLSFDTYLNLKPELKTYLGIDDKWIGIAIEAIGEYWHSVYHLNQLKADRKKKKICIEKKIILIEISNKIDPSKWIYEFLTQMNQKTGVLIQDLKEKIRSLGRFND